MYRVTDLDGTPSSTQDFDRYYDEKHIPLAQRMAGLTGWTVCRFDPAPGGTPPQYHCLAELYTDIRADLELVLESQAGREATADLDNFASGGAIFLFGEEREVPV
ncbi:EthD family reductase [Kribbella qitaiheensis]|uniref:EthD family reductase n=1 Tax=Kribbella qitaiheensis TaxID=1544730 RepID=A0A7G6X558_9ACTN|nr:EthD family reductase [Kribbella qitaiheensis]QNE21373.1 EthD family reductase [Kribbella qitaiheensis]